METKPFYLSKTLWINILVGVAAISGALGFDLGLDPETQTAIVGGVMAVINVMLRLVTKTGVSS